MTFEEIYQNLRGVEACRELVKVQSAGQHDMRLRLREKELTHEAIVELADKLESLQHALDDLRAK